MPAFHAITGCDYTATFPRKGKVRPFQILEKNRHRQIVFGTLGVDETLTDAQISGVEEFVCLMYGKHNASNINKAR